MDDNEGTTAAWLMIGIVLAFKFGLTIFVLIAYPSTHNLLANAAANWPIVLGVLFFAASPLAFWIRLVRVRARRAKLLRAEWQVESEVH